MEKVAFKEKKNTYKSVSMKASKDKTISFKARGILYYLYGMSEKWKGQVFNIVKASDLDGRASVQAGLRELRDAGYARLVTPPKVNGRFVGKYYEVSDHPIFKKNEK